MTMGEFRTRIASLSFIDRDTLVLTRPLSLASPNTPHTAWADARWCAFRDNPVHFFMREATPSERDDIWRASDKLLGQLDANK